MHQFKRILKYSNLIIGNLLIIVIFACATGKHDPGENIDFNGEISRVIHGENALHGEFPWQVQISYNNKHRCGGALLTNRWVLTAGHCAHDLSIDGYNIVLGEHQISVDDGTEQGRSVDKLVVHPNFYPTDPNTYPPDPNYNDIALLRLSSPVILNDHVNTIALPDINDDSTGLEAVLTGWGWTRPYSWLNGMPSNADILQEGVLPIRENSACDSTPELPRELKTVEICAGYSYDGQAPCYGDSGGPLVVQKNGKWIVVGVVSWGEGGYCSTYSVFARVSSFVPWINSIIDEDDDIPRKNEN